MDSEFNWQLHEYFEGNVNKAAEFFNVTTKTISRWQKGKPCSIAKKLLSVAYRGYLPQDGPWKKCHINKDGDVVTPWGICRPSDLAFVHHYKNHTRLQTEALKRYRSNNKELADLIVEMQTVMDKLSLHQSRLKAL